MLGLAHRVAPGAAPVMHRTRLGGALSLAATGAVAALAASLVIDFRDSNVLVQQAVLPALLPQLVALARVPLYTLALPASGSGSPPADAASHGGQWQAAAGVLLSPPVTSGFAVEVALAGARCGSSSNSSSSTSSGGGGGGGGAAVVITASDLAAGAVTVSSFYNATDGAAVHRLVCAGDCVVGGLSKATLQVRQVICVVLL
jgi:hypothetical protein